jgi:hypothetical protein
VEARWSGRAVARGDFWAFPTATLTSGGLSQRIAELRRLEITVRTAGARGTTEMPLIFSTGVDESYENADA